MSAVAWRAGLALAVVVALAPFYWMVLISLTDTSEMTTYANPWLPAPDSTLVNYRQLLTSADFWRWEVNTLVVTGAALLLTLGASLAAAQAVAAMRPATARGLLGLLLATYALPQTVLALPLLVFFTGLHLNNTQLALVIAYPSLTIPFGTWVLWRRLGEADVRSALEQAELEGARGWRLLGAVVLPLAAPALAAVAIFTVAVVLSDYLYLFTLITDDRVTTVMGAVQTTNVDLENPGWVFAAMLLGAGPLAAAGAWYGARYAGSLAGAVSD